MSQTGSKIMSLVWSCCQRDFNVFGHDQEILRAVSVLGLQRSLERDLGVSEIRKKKKKRREIDLKISFSATGRAATSQTVRVRSEAEGGNWNTHTHTRSLQDNWKPRAEENKNIIEPPERENETS